MAESWTKFLTKDEYWSLTHPGRVMADYWTQWLPKMCRQMKTKGTLYPTLKEKGESLLEQQVELMQAGLAEDGAWEVIKEQIYSLKPEEDEEEMAEMLEMELRYLWMMMDPEADYETFKKRPDVIAQAKANL